MLCAPNTGVGGIDREQLDAGGRCHRGEPVAEHRGGDAGDHGAAKAFPARAAPHGLAGGRPGVGEVEIFNRDRGDAIPLRVVDQ